MCVTQVPGAPWQTSTSPISLLSSQWGMGSCYFLSSLCSLAPCPLSHLCPLLTGSLSQPCLLRAQPGSGLRCEVGECTGPAAPFLASSRLLIPCEAHISSWCDPCTCSQICLCSSWDPVPCHYPAHLYTLKAEKKISFSLPSHSFSSWPHPTRWEVEVLAFSSSFVINPLYDGWASPLPF